MKDEKAAGVKDPRGRAGSDMPAPPAGHANPLYGTGIFRRRVRLENRPGAVQAELEDCSHGFRLCISHDGMLATAISVETLRFPLSTCMEAGGPLAGIAGFPLAASWMEFQRRFPASGNCTHLHDLAWWALQHASRTQVRRDYEVAVSDEGPQGSECSVWRDGERVLRWQAARGVVAAPAEIAGRPMLRGFSAWTTPLFQGDAYEAAIMLQRGYLVAQGRRYDKQASAGKGVASHRERHGACYSYSEGAVERAIVTFGSDRDFTHAPELLLKFEQRIPDSARANAVTPERSDALGASNP